MDEKKINTRQRKYYNEKRRDHRQNRRQRNHRNIRFGTKFCGECRACEFWIVPKFGKFRCENSYLPFEILEYRRDGKTNKIKEIVINLLV